MTDLQFSHNIAIIDDDEAVSDSLGALLVSVGYRVKSYGSALEFVRGAQGDRVAAIVLDHSMPGMTGLELIEQFHAEGRATPVIFISGNMSDAVRARAERAGARAVLEKPFDDDGLLDALRKLGIYREDPHL